MYGGRNAAANTRDPTAPAIPFLDPATSFVENTPYDKDLFYMAATMWW
jgi:hypothetical protein